MLISFKNTLRNTFRGMFDHIAGHWGPARLTRKISHHKPQPKPRPSSRSPPEGTHSHHQGDFPSAGGLVTGARGPLGCWSECGHVAPPTVGLTAGRGRQNPSRNVLVSAPPSRLQALGVHSARRWTFRMQRHRCGFHLEFQHKSDFCCTR